MFACVGILCSHVMTDVVSLLENYIDGSVFLTLTEGEVKAMVPPLGLVRKIMKLLPPPEEEVS